MHRSRLFACSFLLLILAAAVGFVQASGSVSRGAAVQALQPAPDSLDFADFPVGSPSTPQSLTILNAADLDLTPGSVTLGGAAEAERCRLTGIAIPGPVRRRIARSAGDRW